MNCNHCQKLLHQYLDESLSSEKRASVEEHLQSCDGCREAVLKERGLAKSIRELLERRTDRLTLQRDIQRDVLKALESGAASPKTHKNYRRVLLRPALALGAIACLLVVAITLIQNHKPQHVKPVMDHPRSYIMCMATTYADEAKTDWIERHLIVEMRNGIEGYLKIIARKPPKETQTNQEEEES